jgi:hypothetical protein
MRRPQHRAASLPEPEAEIDIGKATRERLVGATNVQEDLPVKSHEVPAERANAPHQHE